MKSTVRYHLPPNRMAVTKNLQLVNAGKSMEKREPSMPLFRGLKTGNSHDGEQYGSSLINEQKRYHMICIPTLGSDTNKKQNWSRHTHLNVPCSTVTTGKR